MQVPVESRTATVGVLLRAEAAWDAASLGNAARDGRVEELLEVFRRRGDPLTGQKLIWPAENEGQRQWLARNPEHPRAKLDRYVMFSYIDLDTAEATVDNLRRETDVEFAYASGGSSSGEEGPSGENQPPLPPNRWHLDAINANAAWALQTGWISIGAMDSGLDTTHPKFLPFTLTAGTPPVLTYNGGNWVKALSRDVVNTPTQDQTTVHEFEAEDGCSFAPQPVGHGTHVAGLMAASDVGNSNAVGVCHDCSLLVTKRGRCAGEPGTPQGGGGMIEAWLAAAITHQVDFGASVINYSGALNSVGAARRMSGSCMVDPLLAECVALSYAERRGVVVVASVGNTPFRSIGFPAADVRSVAVAGLDQYPGGARLWLQVGPNRVTDGECPEDPPPPFTPTNMRECGSSGRWSGTFSPSPSSNLSNYYPHDRAPELSAPARNVYSTFFQGGTWVPFEPSKPNANSCMDANDGIANDRFGVCTGTSMSAPIVAGIAGLLRSTNPHLRVGKRDEIIATNPPSPIFENGYGYDVQHTVAIGGVREALELASAVPGPAVIPAPPFVSGTPAPSDRDLYGSGLPNAEVALRAVLGRIDNEQVVNRVTPAYYMRSGDPSPTASDERAVVTVPQQTLALQLNGYHHGYALSGVSYIVLPFQLGPWAYQTIPEQSYMEVAVGGFYVFTTPVKPIASWPGQMQPIFLLDRDPAIGVQDLSWAVGLTDVTARVAAGWDYLGRQGFLAAFDGATSGTEDEEGLFVNCFYHPDLVKIHRMCKPSDCVIVTEHDLLSMNSLGYVHERALGCAVRPTDSDADSLPNGFEAIVGLNPSNADTDGDGCSDGVEYPYTELPKTDPGVAGVCP